MRNTSANSVTGGWLWMYQGSGLRHKRSAERLAEQQIHTFKHCLCFNPTHPGTWALRLPIRRHWVNSMFRILLRLIGRCLQMNTGVQVFHPVCHFSRVQLESSVNLEAMGMNMLKVFGLVFIHTHTHIHTQRHSPLTHPALCRSYYVTLLRAEVWYGNNQVHIICETPLLIMWHSQSKSIQSSRPMIQNHFHCCELPGVLPPGWIRRWHMMLFHCQMHLLWERPWSVSFFFYF